MTASTATPEGAAVTGIRPGGAARPMAALAGRLIRRGGLIVVVLGLGMSAVVAGTYDALVTDTAAAGALGALAANPAVRTLFGEPFALDTVGGFTVWRTGTVLAVLVSVWAILAITRITRSEEDAGRWNLLLTGPVRLRTVVAIHLAVVGAVPVLLAAGVAAALTPAGSAGSAVHATGICLIGLFFAGLGGVAAQVFPSRSSAAAAAIAALAVSLVARMVGDGLTALAWLRWISPFGLLELSRPFAGDRWGPMLPLGAATVLVWAAALIAASRRDVGGGLLAPAAARPPRTALLGSVIAFALRRMLRPLLGWCAGVGTYFLIIGLIATTMTGFLAGNPVFADAAGQAGFANLGSVRGYAATLFALLAVPVGVFAAERIGAFATAEADRRLTLLAAQPISRVQLLGAEVVAVTGAAVLLTTAAGTATWLGVAATGGGLSVLQALAGVWNTIPLTLLCVGAATGGVGLLPRAAAVIGTVPAVGGFLLLVIAESTGAPGWVVHLSPFAHLAAVPVTPPNWPAAATMIGLALLTAAIGFAVFHRRDLRL